MHPPDRRLVVVLALTLVPAMAAGQAAGAAIVDTAALQNVLVAEDARGGGPDAVDPLLAALTSGDTLVRRVAVRGIGRLQRPVLARVLVPRLGDSLPRVRAEAANAIAQSLRGVRRGATSDDTTGLTVPDAAAALSRVLAREPDAWVAGVMGQSLGRLALPDSTAARAAEQAIRARLARTMAPGLVHGLYTLARARRVTGNLEPATVVVLRRVALIDPDAVVRRLALLAIAAAGGLDSATAVRTIRDRDDESRRMTLRGAGTLSPALRASLVRRASSDPSAIVRAEGVAAARLGDGPPDCTPILAATHDRDPYVVLTAIDSLGSGCAGTRAAAARLRQLATTAVSAGPADHRWQSGAHAMLALARLDSTAAAGLLARAAGATRWEVRQYAARAAGVLGASPVLVRLAADAERNVQEAAITGLAATVGHAADSVYLGGLGSAGNQVVLAASEALKGTTHPDAVAALLDAFDRLSASRSENTKDPRVSILERIGELGMPANAPRLTPYLGDYDTTVAAMAATTLTRWTGDTVVPRPSPLRIRAEPLAEVYLRRSVQLRVTMAESSGGGTFTVRLLADEAPASVARVLRLVREGFYDGKVFQRVEPNFVVQGGGPDANEYVGDSRFMRDELSWRTHARGTVGISSRGRDTGDGQWFINLVDNPLLDHEYTVVGWIDGGQAIVERILEGDRIARVEVM